MFFYKCDKEPFPVTLRDEIGFKNIQEVKEEIYKYEKK